MEKSNSQVENTPDVIYSIGYTRKLNWKSRHISRSLNGRNVWVDNTNERLSFSLDSDTVTIINPLDENPLSFKTIQRKSQYLHGCVNVSGVKFRFGLVCRVVKSTCTYNLSDNTMVLNSTNENNDVMNSCLGIDVHSFHSNLSMLYHNTIYYTYFTNSMIRLYFRYVFHFVCEY